MVYRKNMKWTSIYNLIISKLIIMRWVWWMWWKWRWWTCKKMLCVYRIPLYWTIILRIISPFTSVKGVIYIMTNLWCRRWYFTPIERIIISNLRSGRNITAVIRLRIIIKTSLVRSSGLKLNDKNR